MITVVCFLWHDPNGKNNDLYIYGVEHVAKLKRMVDRHLTVPHEFVCITDRPQAEMPEGVRAEPINMATHVPGSRFVKLQLYRPDAEQTLGKRLLCLDLDTVIVRNIDALVDRPEDLVLWRNPNFGGRRRARYNTSIVLLRAGARPEFWRCFDKDRHPQILSAAVGGTDQAWVSHLASSEEAHWTDKDGIYGAGRLLDIVPGVQTTLPDNARIVFFPGRREPSMQATQQLHPWIAEHYA